MKHIAIFYASKEGQTEKIANRIASTIRSESDATVRLFDIESIKEPIKWFPYDGVIIGGSVHQCHHSKTLIQFINDHRSLIEPIPSAFFSVSLSAAGDPSQKADAKRLVDDFLNQTGWRPNQTEVFAGALMYRKYNPFIRWIMKRISAKAGGDTDTRKNHEYTDWERVKQFATGFMVQGFV